MYVTARYDRPAQLWTLDPTPARLDALEGVTAFRQVMQMGPNTWLRSGHHHFDVFRRAAPDGPTEYHQRYEAEETEGVHISPRGDRATIRVDYAVGGLPVFDAPTGMVAYRVTDMPNVTGVSFSPDGEILALAGGGGHGKGFFVRLLAAATGEMIAERALDREPYGILLDPVLPLVYVGLPRQGPDGADRPDVLVLSVSSFGVVAELRVPDSVTPCGIVGCYKGVIARSVEPALYVANHALSGMLEAQRFAIPPSAGR